MKPPAPTVLAVLLTPATGRQPAPTCKAAEPPGGSSEESKLFARRGNAPVKVEVHHVFPESGLDVEARAVPSMSLGCSVVVPCPGESWTDSSAASRDTTTRCTRFSLRGGRTSGSRSGTRSRACAGIRLNSTSCSKPGTNFGTRCPERSRSATSIGLSGRVRSWQPADAREGGCDRLPFFLLPVSGRCRHTRRRRGFYRPLGILGKSGNVDTQECPDRFRVFPSNNDEFLRISLRDSTKFHEDINDTPTEYIRFPIYIRSHLVVHDTGWRGFSLGRH